MTWRRVVVKVGTSSLTDGSGRIHPPLLWALARGIGGLQAAGARVVLVSSGAGAGGQNAIGWAVVGGMLSATVLAIFFVPMFFVVVLRLFGSGGNQGQQAHTE